jgi:hypothetical protein
MSGNCPQPPIKIEDGKLYWYTCCDWQLIGPVGLIDTAEPPPDDMWITPENPNPVYYACGRAKAVVDAIYAVANAAWDQNDNPLFWQWPGQVNAALPGYDLKDKYSIEAVILGGILRAPPYSMEEEEVFDIQSRQTILCRLVNQFQDENVDLTEEDLAAIESAFNQNLGFDVAIFGAAVNAIGKAQLSTIAKLGAVDDEANCDCPELPPGPPVEYDWLITWDFKTGLHGWTDFDGLWTEGVGIHDADVVQWDVIGRLLRSCTDSGTLRYMAVHVPTWPANPGGGGVEPSWLTIGGSTIWYDADLVGVGWLTKVLNAPYNAAQEWGMMKYQFTDADPDGQSTWDTVIIAGTGNPPFAS